MFNNIYCLTVYIDFQPLEWLSGCPRPYKFLRTTIYREIDGPTIRTTIAERVNVDSINTQLSSSNTSLTKELDSATSSNIVYQAALDDAKERIDRLTSALDASRRLNAEQWEILEAYREQFPIH